MGIYGDGQGMFGHDRDGAGQNGRGERSTERDWLGKPYEEPDDDRRYVCSNCQVELHLSICQTIERVAVARAGYAPPVEAVFVRIIHACPCTAWVRKTRYPWSDSALRRLFMGKYSLPWSADDDIPEGEGVVVTGDEVYPSPHSRREAIMKRWAWDLEGVVTAHDFLLFCRGGRNGGDYSSSS